MRELSPLNLLFHSDTESHFMLTAITTALHSSAIHTLCRNKVLCCTCFITIGVCVPCLHFGSSHDFIFAHVQRTLAYMQMCGHSSISQVALLYSVISPKRHTCTVALRLLLRFSRPFQIQKHHASNCQCHRFFDVHTNLNVHARHISSRKTVVVGNGHAFICK